MEVDNTMSLKRTTTLMGAVILALTASMPAAAQNLKGLQLFAPAEVTPYGQVKGPPAAEGFFFTWDNLRWSISNPEIASIGLANGARIVDVGIGVPPDYSIEVGRNVLQTNGMDTGALEAFSVSGDRFEVGRIIDDHGWMVSTYHLKPQAQYLYGSDVGVIFNDPQGLLIKLMALAGDPPPDPPYTVLEQPVVFSDIVAKNSVETWSVELMYIKRSRQMHRGGFFEFFGGLRYMEFDELFWVEGSGPGVIAGEDGPGQLEYLDSLNDSNWNTQADNHIFGPQVGLRWFNKWGRWMISTEGRFLAGYNSQTIRQHGALGTKAAIEAPNNGYPANGFNSRVHIDEFSPCGELRAELRWQATRAVSLRAGWTGVWINNIARPSNMINYEVPLMGINTGFNRQDVFINGVTLGVDINR